MEDSRDLSHFNTHSHPQSPSHTAGHIHCPACEETRAMLICSISADLPFAEAAARYMQLRSVASTPGAASARYVRLNTEKDYDRLRNSANLFFADTRLADIHWYNMRTYQDARSKGAPPFVRYRRPQDAKKRVVNGVTIMPKGKTPCPAKPQQVNKELRFVKKLKMLAGCWTAEDEAYFEQLQEDESDVERALTPEQQKLWLDACRSNPRWELVYWWSIVSFDLVCSPGELRGLQLGHVNLYHQTVRIPWASSKNPYRHRDIPIENPETLWALERIMGRAGEMGAKAPMHYLFPFKITRANKCHPETPMTSSGLKKLWQEVRDASGLSWFRMEDTRHTGATRLAESGVPAAVIMTRMGHSNPKQQQHYQHISDQAQKMWMRHAQQQPPLRYSPPPQMPPQGERPGFPRWHVEKFSKNGS